jgi:hypothetical protein
MLRYLSQIPNAVRVEASDVRLRYLMASDVTLIAITAVLYLAYFTDAVDSVPAFWNMAVDRSFGEISNYLKFIAMAAILILAPGPGRRARLGLAYCLIVLLLDDSQKLHEAGGSLVRLFFFPPELQLSSSAVVVGELIAWAVLGSLCLLFLAFALWGAAAAERQLAMGILFRIGLIALFAVGVDIIHHLFPQGGVLPRSFPLVEDGGEMLAISVLLAYVVRTVGLTALAGLIPPSGQRPLANSADDIS